MKLRLGLARLISFNKRAEEVALTCCHLALSICSVLHST